jgi:hypothetical protein
MRTPVRESLTDTPSSVTSWPPIAIPATRAPSIVELVIGRALGGLLRDDPAPSAGHLQVL